MLERILGQKNRKRIRYSVLYFPICPVAGKACKREKINQREIGTTIRQIWLAVVTTFSKKRRGPSTMHNESVATSRRYCAGNDDKAFFVKGC